MSSIITTRCDFCNKVKGETNAWWEIFISGPHDGVGGLVIRHADGPSHGADSCGMQCSTIALSRFMDHGTLEDR